MYSNAEATTPPKSVVNEAVLQRPRPVNSKPWFAAAQMPRTVLLRASPRHPQMPRLLIRPRVAWAALSVAMMMVGCASSPGDSALSKPLEWFGLKGADVPASGLPAVERKATLRIHAGERLNTDSTGRSLSIVLRIYKLKDISAFLSAPPDSFQDAEAEQIAFGNDLVEAREVLLTPGQKYEVIETFPSTVSHLAVVALFRAPAAGRWRFAFPVQSAQKDGVTLGVHACAMSVSTGQPVDTPPEMRRLAGVQCH